MTERSAGATPPHSSGTKTGVKILLGCLALPFVLMLIFVILFLAYRAMPLPPSEQADAAKEPGGSVTLEQLAAEGLSLGRPVPSDRAMPVSMFLEEGNFTVVPAPAGTGFRVEGQYDKAMYDLKQEVTRDGEGNPSVTISFKPKYSMLRRLLTQGSFRIDDNTNALTVFVPRDVPIALSVHMRKGHAELNLGGLSLASAALDVGMGENEVTVNEPNPIEMTEIKVNAAMGELRLSGLSNLRAGAITIWGKMGEITVDLGTSLTRDTKMFARMKMGEMRLGLPPDARISGRTSAFLGDTSGSPDQPEGARHLELDAQVTMGELKYLDSHAPADPL